MLVSRSLDAQNSSSGGRLAFRNKELAIIAFFQKLRDADGTRKTPHAAHGGFEISLAWPWPSKTEKRCAMVPFRSATQSRAALLNDRMVCHACVASNHALACRNLPKAQANVGIFINLSRVRLNRRSTSTSFRSSPMINVKAPPSIWPVAAR